VDVGLKAELLLSYSALLGVQALVPCNRYWPQLEYCQLQQQQAAEAKSDAEVDAGERGPEPPCYFDREPACDENGNPEPDPNIPIQCSGSVCRQGDFEVTAPSEDEGCQGEKGAGSWLALPAASPSGAGFSCSTASPPPADY
jgi:hypothetical protein